MKHELNILEYYANAKVYGDKLFEIRDNTDRGFQKGDTVKYRHIKCFIKLDKEVEK